MNFINFLDWVVFLPVVNSVSNPYDNSVEEKPKRKRNKAIAHYEDMRDKMTLPKEHRKVDIDKDTLEVEE